jgi:epoxyqueuosine reductase
MTSAADEDTAFASDSALQLDLAGLLRLSDDEFRARFRHTPLWRPRRIGLLRNAAIVVANGEHFDALPEVRALLQDDSPVLREVASWAVGRMQDVESLGDLEIAISREEDPEMRDWMRSDLSELKSESRMR